MVHFTCSCGNALFFENSLCLQCGSQVGYDLETNEMVQLGNRGSPAPCRNGVDYQVCNWVTPCATDHPLCPACRLNRTIPDLAGPGNCEAWRRMESAKRRVLYSLGRLGLRLKSKAEATDGLAFDFLSPTATMPVLTGHQDGVITVNLLEADDSYRETIRATFREPARTLVGHFRHELGHYFWDRFFGNRSLRDPLLQSWREIFGDESVDYEATLRAYHSLGPPASWQDTHITAYAACHPWEDWAETWAHYLHIVEGTETARHFGWSSEQVPIPFTPFAEEPLAEATQTDDSDFVATINGWAKLAPALNEIATSLGGANLYPFVLSPSTVRKLHFVHHVIKDAGHPDKSDPPPTLAPAMAA